MKQSVRSIRPRLTDAPVVSMEDIMAEVFKTPANAARIYRSLAKCAPYAKFRSRRNTLGAKLKQHMTPMMMERLGITVNWELLGMLIIRQYLVRRAVSEVYGSRRLTSNFRRRAK